MNEGEIRMLAQLQAKVAEMNAILCEVEGMKALNAYRLLHDESIAYNEDYFFEAGKRLREIANDIRVDI